MKRGQDQQTTLNRKKTRSGYEVNLRELAHQSEAEIAVKEDTCVAVMFEKLKEQESVKENRAMVLIELVHVVIGTTLEAKPEKS